MRFVFLISAVLILFSPALIACEASREITPSLTHALPVTSVTEAYGQIQKNGVMVQGRKWKIEKTIDSRGVTLDYELLPGQPSLDDLGADRQTEGVETGLRQQGAKMTPILEKNITASPQYVAVCGGGNCGTTTTGGDAIVGSCGTDCSFLSTIFFGIQDNGDATPAQLCQAWRNYSYSQQTHDCYYITQDLTTLASNEYDLDGVFVTYGNGRTRVRDLVHR